MRNTKCFVSSHSHSQLTISYVSCWFYWWKKRYEMIKRQQFVAFIEKNEEACLKEEILNECYKWARKEKHWLLECILNVFLRKRRMPKYNWRVLVKIVKVKLEKNIFKFKRPLNGFQIISPNLKSTRRISTHRISFD